MSQDTDPLKMDKLKRKARMLIAGAVALIVIIGGYRYYRVVMERNRLAQEASLGPHVQFVALKKSDTVKSLTLVGEALPYATATLYAKISGYLRTVNVDKGDMVKKNQLLAVIESSETDKDYQGALADAKNKKTIAGRMNALRARSLVSPQEADQAESDFEVAQSRLDSLAVQKSYEELRAPFPGRVTSRYADPGALVQNAMSSQTSAQPVVTVSQVDKLRVYVYVDQRDAAYVQVDGPAQVKLAERPDLDLKATVTRVSGELDEKTKMLLTEIDIDNTNHLLVPGSFVQVTLVLHTPEWLQAPVAALLVQQGKSQIAVLDNDDHIHLREVTVGDNDGQLVTILSGVKEGDWVALNLGSNIPDGSHVRPMKPEAKPADKPADPKPASEKTVDKPEEKPATETTGAASPSTPPSTPKSAD